LFFVLFCSFVIVFSNSLPVILAIFISRDFVFSSVVSRLEWFGLRLAAFSTLARTKRCWGLSKSSLGEIQRTIEKNQLSEQIAESEILMVTNLFIIMM
jgi:hypothetical protein